MYKQILETIDGIGFYPLFSLAVFFLFFLAVGIWVLRADNKQLDEISRLPLQNDDNTAKSDSL